MSAVAGATHAQNSTMVPCSDDNKNYVDLTLFTLALTSLKLQTHPKSSLATTKKQSTELATQWRKRRGQAERQNSTAEIIAEKEIDGGNDAALLVSTVCWLVSSVAEWWL